MSRMSAQFLIGVHVGIPIILVSLLFLKDNTVECWEAERHVSDLKEIPEKIFYILKDYDFEKQKHHAKDKGLTDEQIQSLGAKVAAKRMKVALYNKGHPKYHITVWIGDMMLEGSDFVSGQEFEKDHAITGRKCKSVYTVEGAKINGKNTYENGEKVAFEAVVKKEELLLSVTSKSGCSQLRLERGE